MKAKLRDQQGFTLVELIVSIAIGALVTLAATTVLLLGLRMFHANNETATRQNNVRAAYTVIHNLANGDKDWKIEYIGKDLTINGALTLNDVSEFECKKATEDSTSLYHFQITFSDGHSYEFSVNCTKSPQYTKTTTSESQ